MEKVVKIDKNLIKQILETFGTPAQFELHNDSSDLLYTEMGDFFNPETRVENLKNSFGNMFSKNVKCNDSLPINTIKFFYTDEKVIDENVKTNKI